MSSRQLARGYGLISIILVVLGVFTVALGFISNAHVRINALQEEAIIETLHRTRVSAIGYFQEFGSWPNLELLRERTQLDTYVLDAQVNYSPAFHIRVRLSSSAKAQAIQKQLHGSTAQGAWLHILMPSEQELSELAGERLVWRWPHSKGEFPSMETDLSMQNYDLQNVAHLDSVDMSSGKVTTHTGYSGDTSVMEGVSERLNIDSVSVEFLEGERASVGVLSSSMGVAQQTQVNKELRARVWQQKQVQTTRLQAAEGRGRETTSNTTQVSQLMGKSMSIQALLGDVAELETVSVTEGYFSNLSAEIWNAEHVQSMGGNTRWANTNDVSTQNLNVSQNLYVSHGIGDSINASLLSTSSLYQKLENCWYIDKWCRPPEVPNVSQVKCSGCEQTASEGLFQGTLDFQVGYCLHGCDIQIEAHWASRARCIPDNISIGMDGHARCSFERYLAAGDSLSDRALVRVASGKDALAHRTIEANIRWETPIACPQTNYLFPIQGSNPPANGSIALPETQAGMQASHADVGGVGCNVGYKFSHWSCSITGFCSAQGTWQDVSGQCMCDYSD